MLKMAKWTREQTTMLLELYKQHPHLYDHRNICYSDRNERQRTLLIIAKELDKIRPKTTIRDLKQKIRTIRTQYCVEKHKFYKSTSKDFYSPRLWCYDSLKFLDGIPTYETVSKGKHKAPRLASPSKVEEDDSFGMIHNSEYNVPKIPGGVKKPDVEVIEVTMSQSLPPENINCDVDEPISPNIQFAQKPAEQINNGTKSRNHSFAKFICEELDSIQDREILEDAKWDIQMAIRNALKQDRKRINNESNNSFQSSENRLILSPSPSQSSSSACFQNTGIKQEMSEDDV